MSAAGRAARRAGYGQTARRVVYGTEGARVDAGGPCVIMAPPGVHMTVSGGRVRLVDEPERHSCRPSVDVLFESVARDYGAQAIGCRRCAS